MRSDIRTQLAALNPDVVHIHGEFNPDNLRIPGLFQCPIVLSPRGALNLLILQKSKRWSKRFYIAMARHLLYRKVVFHALTPLEKQHIMKILPEATVYVVPQGPRVQMETFLDKEGESCQTFAPPIRLLFVGRLDIYTKGLDMLLRAFAQATGPLCQRANLTLVGPDWSGSMSVLKNLAKALDIEGCVNMPGTITGPTLADVVRQSHIYIHVSRHEGFGSAVAEALLFGKPAILTDATGIASYPEISSLPHVLVVPSKVDDIAEAIARAIEHVEELQKIACEHRSVIRGFFSWDRAAAKYLKMYRDLCT